MSKLLRCVPVLLLMPLFIAGCTGAKSEQNQEQERHNWQTENLKGAVKSYTQSIYKATDMFGKIEKGDRGFSTYFLEDDLRNITATYNEKGNLIEVSEYNPISGSLSQKTNFLYDDNGKQIEENSYDADGVLEGKKKLLYDEKGKLTEINTYAADSSLAEKVTFVYDEKGNQIERNRYMPDGSLNWREKYAYNEKGYIVEKIVSVLEDVFLQKSKFTYDKSGNRIEVSISEQDGLKKANGKIAYDDEGNPVEWSSLDSEGNTKEGKFTYQYDKKGNWTQMVIYKNGIPKNIVEREYTYY